MDFVLKFLKSHFNLKNLFLSLLIIFVPLISWKQNLDTTLYIRFLVLNIIILFSIIFFFKKIKLWNYNKWLILYLAYIIASFINLLFSSNLSDAIFQFANIISFGLLVFLFYNIFKNEKVDFYSISFIFLLFTDFVLIKLLFEFLDVVRTLGVNHHALYNIKAGFSHKNILSEVLLMILPYSLFSIFKSSKFFRINGIINSILIFFFITILLTRAVWVALIIGTIVSLITFLVTSRKFLSTKKAIKATSISFVLILLILVTSLIIYSKQDSFETIKKSVKKISVLYDSSQHRFELWNRSLDIFYTKPIFGTGLATWKIEVLKYGNRNLQSEDNITFYQRPHNDYLWILSEQGIIGFLLYLLTILLILKYLLNIIRRSNDIESYLFWILILLSYIGYLTFSFFSFPKERIEHNIFLAVIFGIVLAYNDRHLILKSKIQKIIFSSILLISIICNVYIGYQRVKSDYFLKKAFVERNARSWNDEIRLLNKSENFFYKIDPFSTPLAWYRGEAYFNFGNVDRAFFDFKNAYIINPNHIHVINNLATCYVIKGENSIAIRLYKKAIELSPTFNEAILNLTAVFYNLNQIDSAISIIKTYKGSNLDEKYRNYLITVLKAKITNFKTNCDDKMIINILENILLNNDWIINIFEKSIEKNINFENQLLIDLVYTLENIEKSIDNKQKEQYYKKYKL